MRRARVQRGWRDSTAIRPVLSLGETQRRPDTTERQPLTSMKSGLATIFGILPGRRIISE